MKKVFLNSLLTIFGLSLGLIIAEFSVQLLLPQSRMVTWLEMHPQGFMMNQSGGTAFQEYNDRTAYYDFTESRLRGNDSIQTDKTILAIGDSFTFGLLLNEENTYIYQIQEKMSLHSSDSVQILNGGIGGAGLADWPAWLQTFGSDLKPDVILYFMHLMDLDRSLSKNLYVLQGDTLLKSQRWQPRPYMTELGRQNWYRWLQANSDLANLIVKILWKHVYFIDLTENFSQVESSVPIPDENDFYMSSGYSLDLGISLLQKIQNWCEENDCQLVITTTGFFNQNKDPNHTTLLYNWLKNDADSASFAFFDNTTCVDSASSGNLNRIVIPGDSHPNEEGAQIIANCTWKWFKEKF